MYDLIQIANNQDLLIIQEVANLTKTLPCHIYIIILIFLSSFCGCYIEDVIRENRRSKSDLSVLLFVSTTFVLFKFIVYRKKKMTCNTASQNWCEEGSRLASFQTWTANTTVTPMSLAKAGFYFTGRGDETKCFSCGGLVKGWSNGEIPLEAHRQHFPACTFVQNPQEAGDIPMMQGFRPIVQCGQATQPSCSVDADCAETFDNPHDNSARTNQIGRTAENVVCDNPKQTQSNIPQVLQHNYSHVNAKHGEENMKYEANRLKSFNSWLSEYPVRPGDLAAAGFFYTGSDDEVKCFCCRGRVLCWDEGDEPMDEHRRHFPTCLFLAEPATSGNVPIHSASASSLLTSHHVPDSMSTQVKPGIAHHEPQGQTAADSMAISNLPSNVYPNHSLNQVGNPLQSNVQNPASRGNQPHQPSAVNTSQRYNRDYIKFEKNRLDTFQSWPKKDSMDTSKMAAAGLYFIGPGDKVKCAFCNGAMLNWDEDDDPANEHYKYFGDRCPLVKGEPTDNVPLKGTEVNKPRSTFDLLNIITDRPKNPRFATEAARLDTFKTWPLEGVQDTKVMAKAGFFFTGKDDQVTCFFCSMGLKNWEKTDDPWEQHARWTENCGFLRQVKGEGYMHRVKRSHALIDSKQEKKEQTGHDVDKRQVTAAMTLPMVLLVLNMGFERPLVQTVIEDKFKSIGENFPNAASLAEAVLKWQEAGKPVAESHDTRVPQLPFTPAELSSQAKSEEKEKPLSVEEENRRLKQERRCKECKKKDADVVFLPCGHMVTCQDCSGKLKDCPNCKALIRGTVKAYLG